MLYRWKVKLMGIVPAAEDQQIKTRSLASNTNSLADIYIDNLLFLHNDEETLNRDRKTLLENAKQANVVLNEVLQPSSTFEYWNLLIDLTKKSITLKETFLAKMRGESTWLREERQPTVRQFFRTMGHLMYASQVLETNLGTFCLALAVLRRVSYQFNANLIGFDSLVNLKHGETSQLIDWLQNILTKPTLSLVHPPEAKSTLYVDASDSGWGAVLVKNGRLLTLGLPWTREEEGLHINTKETLALEKALQHPAFIQALTRTAVTVFTDNVTAKATVKRGYSANSHHLSDREASL